MRVWAVSERSPHSALTITARSLVEVRPRPIAHADLSWDGLAAEAGRSIGTVEQLVQTARTRTHPEVADIARPIAAPHDHPGPAPHALASANADAVASTPGTTGVPSTTQPSTPR